jgi:cell shape-determining protein MreC
MSRKKKVKRSSSSKKKRNNLQRLDSSRSFIHSGGRQRQLGRVVAELEAKCKELKLKVKSERKKVREYKKENNELKVELKKLFIRFKKVTNLERDYSMLLNSFNESEKLRQEQKIIIDTMRSEIKKLRSSAKRKKKSTK